MKAIPLAIILGTLAFTSASAQQEMRRPYLYPPGTTIGLGGGSYGYGYGYGYGYDMSQPNSPVSPTSGDVTHPDEQLRGLVPGNPAADGGITRNQGG